MAGTQIRNLLVLTAGLLTWVAARATVEVAPTGFVVRHVFAVAAAPARVYDAAISQVSQWWNPEHTYSGESRNLSIDPRPGGCFCERLGGAGGVEHMRVVYLAPAQMIRMSGGLGPLQSSGVAGALTWAFSPAGPGTRMELTYSVGGFFPGGFEKIAPGVEAMLGEQALRLKRVVETGKP
jgi:hypothetical protein